MPSSQARLLLFSWWISKQKIVGSPTSHCRPDIIRFLACTHRIQNKSAITLNYRDFHIRLIKDSFFTAYEITHVLYYYSKTFRHSSRKLSGLVHFKYLLVATIKILYLYLILIGFLHLLFLFFIVLSFSTKLIS